MTRYSGIPCYGGDRKHTVEIMDRSATGKQIRLVSDKDGVFSAFFRMNAFSTWNEMGKMSNRYSVDVSIHTKYEKLEHKVIELFAKAAERLAREDVSNNFIRYMKTREANRRITWD